MTTIDAPRESAQNIVDLCDRNAVRRPEIVGFPGAPIVTLTWTPDLSPAEQTTVTDIVNAGLSHVSISLAEWQAIKADVAGLVTYQGLASPTLAQTVLAVKAQSRILRALLRN